MAADIMGGPVLARLGLQASTFLCGPHHSIDHEACCAGGGNSIGTVHQSAADGSIPGGGGGGGGVLARSGLQGFRFLSNTHHDTDREARHTQEVGTALGLCIKALQMAADIMGGPVLAKLGLQASTSTIWLPRSFWNPKPPRSGPQAHAPRALYLQTTQAAAPAAAAAG